MEVRQLTQAATRRMALALAALTGLAGLLHIPRVPGAAQGWVLAIGLAGALALLGFGLWLRRPRALASINRAAGLCALLAMATGLLVLGLSRDIHHTVDLALVLVGAGYFLHSTLWYGLTCLLTGLGWALLAGRGAPETEAFAFALPLLMAALLGAVFNHSRRQVLREFQELLARDRARELELRRALEGIKTLRGLVPICAQCKKIRDDRGYWQQVETYVHDHSEAEFTHSLCPACVEAAKAEWESLLPPT